jgi:hypothetical protein
MAMTMTRSDTVSLLQNALYQCGCTTYNLQRVLLANVQLHLRPRRVNQPTTFLFDNGEQSCATDESLALVPRCALDLCREREGYRRQVVSTLFPTGPTLLKTVPVHNSNSEWRFEFEIFHGRSRGSSRMTERKDKDGCEDTQPTTPSQLRHDSST